MSVNLTNTKGIIADSINVKKGNAPVNVLDSSNNIAGLPPETLDSLEKIANAMDNDPNFFQTIADGLGAKLNTQTFNDTMTDVNAEFETIDDELEAVNNSPRYESWRFQ